MKTAILLAMLFLTGCAPMPGATLFPGLDHPSDQQATVVIGIAETNRVCNSLAIDRNPKGFLLNCLFNFCFVLGCADVEIKDGKIIKCTAYSSFNLDFIIEHELKHCDGYADLLY